VTAWLAWLPEASTEPSELLAEAGTGVLAGWTSSAKRPQPQARRIDPRVLDPLGDPAWVSLVWLPSTAMPLYDDPAVLQARRKTLDGPPARAFSTLVVDSTSFAGSLWVSDDREGVRADPFRNIGPGVALRVSAGLLGRTSRPTGPALERYSGAPWPWDGVSV
jgi:hypothetical protein